MPAVMQAVSQPLEKTLGASTPHLSSSSSFTKSESEDAMESSISKSEVDDEDEESEGDDENEEGEGTQDDEEEEGPSLSFGQRSMHGLNLEAYDSAGESFCLFDVQTISNKLRHNQTIHASNTVKQRQTIANTVKQHNFIQLHSTTLIPTEFTFEGITCTYGARYGINTIKDIQERKHCMDYLQLSMQSFKSWSTSMYQKGRPLDLKQQSEATFQSTKQKIHEYLGFLYHFKQVKRPGLHHYLEKDYFKAFMAFLTKRKVDKAGHLKVRFSDFV